jgi:UDP-N-acetylmuramoylalanine-D-glutamate ligase
MSARPDIGVLLNITPDHLTATKRSKPTERRKRVFENQTELDAVLMAMMSVANIYETRVRFRS